MTDAFPSALSPSRANDFQTCPLMFRLKSIDRIPEPPSAAALRGNLVHEVLERLFGLPAADRSLAATESLFADAWVRLAASDAEGTAALLKDARLESQDDQEHLLAAQMVDRVRPLLETYFALEDPTQLNPHARELAISVQLIEGFAIRGFIDRVDMTPAGQVRIVDYKTGKAPRASFESKAMFQMRFYALAWWRMTGEIPAMLQLLYLGSKEALRYEPQESDLLATERKVLSIREQIQRAAESGFTARPSRLCGWCAYQRLCPEFGGTPPELPVRVSWESTAFERARPEVG